MVKKFSGAAVSEIAIKIFSLDVPVYATLRTLILVCEGGFDMDVIKRYIYFADTRVKAMPEVVMYSQKWVQWITHISPATCSYCLKNHGKILAIDDPTIIWPEVHPNCHCVLELVRSYLAGTVTSLGQDGVDVYLARYHTLPEWYVTKEEAKAQGWEALLGNLGDVLPGMMIEGNIYRNWDGRLPQAPGRIWYEADFDYTRGFRNDNRILYSNDGLLFVTFDHYLTFSEIIFWGDY